MHARLKNDFDVKNVKNPMEPAEPDFEYSVNPPGFAGFFKSTSRYFGNGYWSAATGLKGRIPSPRSAGKPTLKNKSLVLWLGKT